jgi:hypothetical protein
VGTCCGHFDLPQGAWPLLMPSKHGAWMRKRNACKSSAVEQKHISSILKITVSAHSFIVTSSLFLLLDYSVFLFIA